MKHKLLTIIFCLFVIQNTMAQQVEPTPIPANPADVSTVDAIMKAVYESISGDAGQPRDWNRFRSLFHKDARLIPINRNQQTNLFGATAFTPEEYIKRAEPVFAQNGFHEKEIARTSESYGKIVHAFSTYEARRSMDDEKPFLRGINSFQLFSDGNRWWIMTIYWQAETPDNLIPGKYERSQVEYLSSDILKGYPFSESVRVGNMIHLSGQIGTDGSGKLVTGGISAETRQTLENIRAALKRYGSSMEDVVKCTVMIAEIDEWSEMNKVYVTFFKSNLPARSAMGVNGLALNARVEIECLALMR